MVRVVAAAGDSLADPRQQVFEVPLIQGLQRSTGPREFEYRNSPTGATHAHHLADTDPDWAGGDVLRIRRLASSVTPPIVRPALGLLNAVPGPVAAALRTGLDTLINLTPKVHPA